MVTTTSSKLLTIDPHHLRECQQHVIPARAVMDVSPGPPFDTFVSDYSSKEVRLLQIGKIAHATNAPEIIQGIEGFNEKTLIIWSPEYYKKPNQFRSCTPHKLSPKCNTSLQKVENAKAAS